MPTQVEALAWRGSRRTPTSTVNVTGPALCTYVNWSAGPDSLTGHVLDDSPQAY